MSYSFKTEYESERYLGLIEERNSNPNRINFWEFVESEPKSEIRFFISPNCRTRTRIRFYFMLNSVNLWRIILWFVDHCLLIFFVQISKIIMYMLSYLLLSILLLLQTIILPPHMIAVRFLLIPKKWYSFPRPLNALPP